MIVVIINLTLKYKILKKTLLTTNLFGHRY
jgi:hypothetical protein